MTSNVDDQLTDVGIERMLRQRAAGAPPVDLAPTIAAMTREVVQRRAAHDGIPGLQRGRGALLLVAATLVTATLVGVTIVGNRDLSVPSERPVVSGESSASTGPSAVVPAVVPSASVVQVAGAPHDFSAETYLRPYLITDEIGWVVTEASLYRTTDGGRTWTDTKPPHDGPLIEHAVVDADTALVASSQGSSSAIAVTHDGGASWSVAPVHVEAGSGPILLFRSPLSGTVSFHRRDGRLQVYATSDGGATFRSPTIGTIPAGEIKLAGWGNGYMWLNLGKADNRPFDNDHLWMSSDGGASWRARRFPVARWIPAAELKWIVGTPLDFSTEGRIVLGISNGDRSGLFRSDDDGRTWQELSAVPAPRGGARNATYHVTDTDWVYTDESSAPLLTSEDAGQHWRTVTGDRVNEAGSYATPTHAWAFHGCPRKPRLFGTRGPDPFCDGNTLASLLLETTDGGRSWHALGQ
jgi:photosystem II stability/assembly factor-like uncharacterized protein